MNHDSVQPTATPDKHQIYCDYLQHGIQLVPIPPDKDTSRPTKAPKTAGWNLDQNIIKSPEQIDSTWLGENWNVGLALLQSNIVSFDIDDLQMTRKVFLEVFDYDLDDLLEAPDAVRIIGNPARAKLLYCVPDDLKDLTTRQLNFSGNKMVFEIRFKSKPSARNPLGNTAQDILPPSIHPDTGQPYEWLGDYRNIPPLPRILADIWTHWEEGEQTLKSVDPDYTTPPERPLKCPSAALIGEASVIDACNEKYDLAALLARNGYKKRGARYLHPGSNSGIPGIVLFDQGGKQRCYSHAGDALNDGHAHDAFDVIRILEYGGDERMAIEELAAELTTTDGITIDAHNKGLYVANKSPIPAPFDESQIYVEPECANDSFKVLPGRLQEIADWLTTSAYRTNAELAQLGALAIACTAAGRMYKTTTGSFSGILSIAVAPTGGGKDFIRKGILSVFATAELADLVGPGSLTSEAAVRGQLFRHPNTVLVIDEIGDKLKRAMNGNDSHEKAAFDSFKEVFSSEGSLWKERGYAPKSRELNKLMFNQPLDIQSPILTLVGLTTPEQLANALQAEHFEGGMLNRFIVVVADKRLNTKRQQIPDAAPPAWLVERIKAIRKADSKNSNGNLAAVKKNEPEAMVEPQPRIVQVEPDAVNAMHLFWVANEEKYVGDTLKVQLSARLHEIAMRLSLSIAVFEDHKNPQITKDLYDWCAEWVEMHFLRFALLCNKYRASSPWDDRRMRILRALRDAGSQGISLAEMGRQPQIFNTGKVKERDELLAELASMELAMSKIEPRTDGRSGRPSVRWYAARSD